MNILDENILKNQRQLLRSWRIRVHQIGYDIGRKGLPDEEIRPLLLQLHHPTFFTRDLGFYDQRFCHQRYCSVCLAVDKQEVAVFVRRLLRYRAFDTRAKRLGSIIRVSHRGLSVWRRHATKAIFHLWTELPG